MHQKISTFRRVWKKIDNGLVKSLKSGVCHGVNEIFALLGCYVMLVGSFRTTYQSHLDPWRWDQ